MPNFLIIGAAKSGTTSLYWYLKQHRQVYMSRKKETNFFAFEGRSLSFGGPGDERLNSRAVTELADYRELFSRVSGQTAVGEASPVYLYSPEAVGRIRSYVPEAKLVAILRNPADRAYSAFTHARREGREPVPDFARALAEEEARVEAGWEMLWHYKRMGFYHEQLTRYYEAFDPDQIRVYLYEDLCDDPAGLLRDLFAFIGVDESFSVNTSVKRNVSASPRSKALQNFLNRDNPFKSVLRPLLPVRLRRATKARLRSRNRIEPPPFSPEVRRELVELYREDVIELQGLIGRDLSGWLR